MHVPVTVALVAMAVGVAVWWLFNRWAVSKLAKDSPPPGRPGAAAYLPLRRRWFAAVAAVVVALMAPFWWFDHEIEARRVAALPENVEARGQLLRSEDDRLREVSDAPLPTVDGDSEIISLRKDLEQARSDRPRLRDELACEADGTCGSRQVGTKDIYQAKAAQLEQLNRRIEALPGQIDQRTDVVEAEIAAALEARAAAESRRADIGRLLSAPPEWSGRRDALDDIAAVRWQTAALVAVAAFAIQYTLDVLLLQTTARRICSHRPRRTGPPPGPETGPPPVAGGHEHFESDDSPLGGSPPPDAGRPPRWPPTFDFRRGEWGAPNGPPRKGSRRRWWWRQRGDE